MVPGSGIEHASAPARHLLDQVVSLAEPLPVVWSGLTAVGDADDVVAVGDIAVASGMAARLVADVQESGVLAREPTAPWVRGGGDAGDRAGEHAPQPAWCVGAAGEVAGGLCGDDVQPSTGGSGTSPVAALTAMAHSRSSTRLRSSSARTAVSRTSTVAVHSST